MKPSFIQTWVDYVNVHQSDFGNIDGFFDAPAKRLCVIKAQHGGAFVFFIGNGRDIFYYNIWFNDDQMAFSGPYTWRSVTRVDIVSATFDHPEPLREAILAHQRTLDLAQVGHVVDYLPVEDGSKPRCIIADVFQTMLDASITPVDETRHRVCLADAYLIQASLKHDGSAVLCYLHMPWYSSWPGTLFHAIDADGIVSIQIGQETLTEYPADRPCSKSETGTAFEPLKRRFVTAPDVSVERFEAAVDDGLVDLEIAKRLRRLTARTSIAMRCADPSLRRLEAALMRCSSVV